MYEIKKFVDENTKKKKKNIIKIKVCEKKIDICIHLMK